MRRLGYISDQENQGLMTALGFEPIVIDRSMDFNRVLKRAIADGFAIVAVSDGLYLKHRIIIDRYNDTLDLTIIVLSALIAEPSVKAERLEKMAEEIIGRNRRRTG